MMAPAELDRWRDVASKPSPWRERLQLIAARIPPGTAVLDVGAGSQELAAMLRGGFVYFPLDVVATRGAVACDLDAEVAVDGPALPDADVVVVSGVLEHLRNPLQALVTVCAWTSALLLLSYATVEGVPDIEARERAGWRNHLSAETLIATCAAEGVALTAVATWNDQTIFEGWR